MNSVFVSDSVFFFWSVVRFSKGFFCIFEYYRSGRSRDFVFNW